MKGIKLFDPVIDEHEVKKVVKTLKSGFWASGAGSGQVHEFETKFKKFINSKSCVSVNSGTAALNLALSLFDIKNKEVILPSLSFVSTAHSIIENGGIPVFADIDVDTLQIDISSCHNLITKKTKAIMPVHLTGRMCDMDPIMDIANKYKLSVIEDAAQSVGSKYKGKSSGSIGDVGCFSFYPTKQITTGEGGMVICNSEKIYNFITILSTI